ncbi:hypothetical protein M422DRAFT_198364 [Sphaerobolus stellatus SS14]|nr:hypothetical protein M422DRAFT_198364 [Sphaerobolus stellatus SS14]
MSYSQGPYYGNVNGSGGGGGGGFLSPFGSQQSPGTSEKKTSQQHSLRSLTILAILNAQQSHGEAAFTVDGVEVGQVTVVAQVYEIADPQTTNLCFRLDDGTGRIDARHWMEENETASEYAHIKEGSFVRVMGTVKVLGGKKHLGAPTIRLSSAKEFIFHMSDTMLVWAQMTLGPATGQLAGTSNVASAAGDASVYTAGAVQAPQDNANYAHLPPLERSILECMQSAPRTDEGVNVNYIVGRLSQQGTRANANEISSALDRLMDEGHIYTTIDDSHFMIA